tara:strand:- start:1427 stop:3715 length:2289 start_codon:yes stop_codon:yes gene_type:complete
MAKTTVDTLLVKIEADLNQLKKELSKTQKQTQHFSKDFKKNFASMGNSTVKLAKNLALVGGAVGTAFGAVAVKKVIGVGMEIEGLQVRLKNLFGGAKAGQEAFDELAKFASKVPFSLQEIQQGAGSLAVVAQDAEHLSRLLTITGNAAALTGLDFATASGQIQRAFAGGAAASDLFRERGLNALLGFEAGATTTAEETAKVFEENLGANGKFGKTTDELAQTLTGTLSMIGDKVFNFQRIIADERFFGTVKKQFEDLNNHLSENQEALDKLGEQIGIKLAIAVEKAVDALVVMGDHMEEVELAIKALGALAIVGIFGKITTAIGLVALATKEAIAELHKFTELIAEKLGQRPERVRERMLAQQKETLQRNTGEFDTTGSPDFTRGGQTANNRSPVRPLGMPDFVGMETEELEKQIVALDQRIKLLNISNETEREFAQILMSTGIRTDENVQKLRVRFDTIKELEKAEEDAEKKLEEVKDAEKKLQDQRKEALRIIDSYKDEQTLLNEKIDEFKVLMGTLSQEELPLATETLEKMKEELRQLDPVVQILEDHFERAFDGIAQSIADSMTEGKNALESFKSVALNIINSLIKEFLRLQMAQMRATMSGGSGGSFLSGIFGGIGDFFGGMFGGQSGITSSGGTSGNFGAFNTGGPTNFGGGNLVMGGLAGGGSISRGMPTVVGERGAELFIPNTSGRIVNNANSRGMMGSQTIINQNLEVNAGVAQTVRAEMLNLLPAFKAETVSAVAESRLRGGEFANAFSGGR